MAWFVLDAVEAMDLAAFYVAYRSDGHGRAAYEPSMMVALLLYAYARGTRSARAIERAGGEDVAYRVIAAQQRPDHATLARFVARHEVALAGLFGAVLALCAEAGLAKVGVIAIDGTKVYANASGDATMDDEQIAREILERPRPPMRQRTSFMARRVATSCRASWRPSTGGAGGCAMPSNGWMSDARRRPSRSRARGRSG